MVNSKKIIARYRELKLEAPDCILLMQVGAFMQVMDNDAKVLSQLTGLKLQMAGEIGDPENKRGQSLSLTNLLQLF